MSLNTAQIGQIAQQYGLNLDPAMLQNVQNNSQGGADEASVIQALQNLPQYQQQVQGSATAKYQAGIDTAVSGLQGQQSNLSQSYGSLLSDVMGQGTVAMNTATSGENAYLASRGLVSQAGAGNNQLSAAQLAVQSQNQAAAGSIGQGSAADISAIQSQIANTQAGGAGTELSIPLQYGSLAMQQQLLPSQIAQQQGQANLFGAQAAATQYQPLAQGGNLYNIANGSVIGLSNILKSLGINVTGL